MSPNLSVSPASSQRRLLLFDGLSVAFRAFYGIKPDLFRAPDGQYTNGVYGFLRMLASTVAKYQPTHLAVAFDFSSRTFRKELYPDYKEGRRPAPEEFAGQVPLIKEALAGLGVPLIELEGYEADDILATLASTGDREGFDVRVVSGDRDSFQLITPRVNVIYPTPKGDVVYDPESFALKYGLPPAQYPELAALVGEGADNLPGVPGVGPKTALAWLQKYGSLAELLAHADEIPGKRGEALRAATPDVLRNRRLNELVRDTPISERPADLSFGTSDPSGFLAVAERCAFGPKLRTELLELFGGQEAPPARDLSDLQSVPPVRVLAGGELALFLSRLSGAEPVGISVLGEANPGAPAAHGIALRQSSELVYARFAALDAEDQRALQEFLAAPGGKAPAVPTSAPSPVSAEGLAPADSAAPVALPALAADGRGWATQSPTARDASARPPVVFSAWKRDYHCLRAAGFACGQRAHDKTLLAYIARSDLRDYQAVGVVAEHFGLCVPPGSFADLELQECCFPGVDENGKARGVKATKPALAKALAHLLLEQPFAREAQRGRAGLEGLDALLALSPVEKWKPGQLELSLVLECCVEAALSAALAPLLYAELTDAQKLLYLHLELPLSPILALMETVGIEMDSPYLEELSRELGSETEALAARARAAVGLPELNLSSPKQLQEALYSPEHLALSPLRKTKRGVSTDAKSLEALAAQLSREDEESPARVFLDSLLAHRDKTKLWQIINGLSESTGRDGRIHTTFVQTGAATGRLSSMNPNLQNIPGRTPEGLLVREAFRASASTAGLMSCDYSQLEMRIMASLSGDEALIGAIRGGEDLHLSMAALVYGVPLSQVSAEQRTHVKATSYGLAYGLSAFGLAGQLAISNAQAKELMNAYFERFKGIKRYLDASVDEATRTGYTETLFGRRRYFPDLQSNNPLARQAAARAALNAPIQGTAADLMKRAMLQVDAQLRARGLASRVLLQIHDELIIEVARGEEEPLRALVVEAMRGADGGRLRVPLTVGVGVGRTWRQAAH